VLGIVRVAEAVVVRAQGHVTSQVDVDTRDLFETKTKG